MRKVLGAALAMAAIVSTATTATASKKDAISYEQGFKMSSQKISPYMGSGDANPRKHIKTPKVNQRQKRKLLRSNPHLRNSKKNPIKKRR